jgi:hypothetical protein
MPQLLTFLGANLPEDAIYPLNLGDESGKPLDGANKYTIHFDKATIPPVNAFWSITLYDQDGFQVANSLNRMESAAGDEGPGGPAFGDAVMCNSPEPSSAINAHCSSG